MNFLSIKRIGFVFLVSLVTAGAVLANDTALRNWKVPVSGTGEITKMGDLTEGIAFVGVDPCRIVDTRGPTGAYGAPALVAGVPRNFDLNDGPCTGIPPGVEAYSLNITVTNTAGPGFILIYPQGGSQPLVSTLNYVAGQTIANAAIVPAGTGGGVTVVAGVSGTDLIIDINGYFSDEFNSPNFFSVVSSYAFGGGVIFGHNLNAAAAGFGGNFVGDSTQTGGGGLRGAALGGTGQTQGVLGTTNSTNVLAAGVLGQSGSSFSGSGAGPFGVLGHSVTGAGVFGESTTRGVNGCRETIASGVGTPVACGVVGFSGNSGIHSFQDVTAGGAKPFVVPYEGDPTKQIMYIATEADQALTSTRGRVKLDRGLATVRVPEHFLRVTEKEGWSVQLTPIGDMATMAVLRIDADRGEVLIKGSRSVEVFYRIEGIRKGYAGFNPVQENIYFVPDSAKAKMDPWPDETKRILVQNGIYHADGMPNLETADRLGWKKLWDQREEAEKAAAAEAPAKPSQD